MASNSDQLSWYSCLDGWAVAFGTAQWNDLVGRYTKRNSISISLY